MKEQKKRFMHKLSLNKRLALVTLLILIPMITLVGYLLYLLNGTNQAFGNVTESITYANNYSTEFRERMDYSMYLAVIRGEPVSMLEEGRVTVNGVKIVNPYSYIEELDQAFDIMEEIATVSSNKNLATRMQRTLNSLSRKVKEIDENMDKSVNYDENLAILRGDIYGLTEIIEGGIQDYISAENAHFSIIRDEMVEQCRTAFQICFLIVVAVSFFAWMLSMMASRSVTRPIRQLCDMAKLLAKGDFSARTDTEAEDEIAVLTTSFNDMAGKIGNLVENIKTEQANLRMTETKLMQAQINPHFLYNALDTVNWMAMKKGDTEICDMVSAISNLMRISIGNKQDIFSIRQELKYVKNYLYIQETRYRDRFQVYFAIDEKILDEKIPKLTIQPLVENAIVHSVEVSKGKTVLNINGYIEQGNVVIEIKDDGVGMDRDTLLHLLDPPEGEEKDISVAHTGLGMYAVHQRLRYLYGEEYGLTADSEPGNGTCIKICIPFTKGEEKTWS